jgi:hypothetical protein
VLPAAAGVPDEWITLLRLAAVAAGLGPDADLETFDEGIARTLVTRELDTAGSPLSGRDADSVMAALEPRVGPERLLDLMLRAGPYGLTLEDLEAAPHGIDLGPLKPRLPDALRTAGGQVELAPQILVDDVPRLRAALERATDGPVLIGRRDLRSNNSWMHNLPVLVRGKPRCTLHINPADAERYGLTDGAPARLRSRTGTLEAEVEVTAEVMPGVVSLPHGWGHDQPDTRLRVARQHAGANSNVLADEDLIDAVSGNAVLNGIPVQLAPAG